MSRCLRQCGFTLIEIMVALMVLAFSAILLADTFGASAAAYSRLDNTTRAWTVASDKLVELQVFQQWPGVGTQDEVVERHDIRWQVRTQVVEGPYPDTRRVDIEVGPESEPGGERLIYWSVSSLLGKPFDAGATNEIQP